MSREQMIGLACLLCSLIILFGIVAFAISMFDFKLQKENKLLKADYSVRTIKYLDEIKEKDKQLTYKSWKIEYLQDELDTLKKAYKDLKENHEMIKSGIPTRDIKKIIHNKKATIVWFKDGNKVIVKPAKDEKGDVYNAVAYATMKNIYGNNTQFKRYVDERVVKE